MTSPLAALATRYLPDLRGWAHGRLPRWLRAGADTSDLIQDAFVRTLARLDRFQPQGRRALAAYLRAAVRNRIIDEHRRASRWPSAPALPDDLPSSRTSPLQQTIDAESVRRYRRALAHLGRRDRELVVAHVELGYSHAQLACMIGRSSNAARMALCRALERLALHMR